MTNVIVSILFEIIRYLISVSAKQILHTRIETRVKVRTITLGACVENINHVVTCQLTKYA